MMHFSKTLFLASPIALLISAGAAHAQTVSLVSGDGQVATQNNVTNNLLVVVVRNFQGQPVPNTSVNWTVTGQGSLTGGATTTTAADGTASNTFLGPTLFNMSFAQATVTASAFGSSVTFTETTSGLDLTAANAAVVQAQVIYPTGPPPISGAAGSIGATAVQVQVFSNGVSGYKGLQNVLIRLLPSSTTGPQISCSGNTGYTTANGYASCLPVFSGGTGSGNYLIDVGGGYRQFGPFPFTVTQGSVSSIILTGGNGQSGAPGSTLPLPLTARTQDINGNPLPNVPVTWTVSPPGAATLNNVSNASDTNGNVTAQVVLGATPGPVQVVLSSSQGGGTQVIYNLQINIQLSGLSKVAGDNQTAITSTVFAQPLVVQVTTSQGPAAGVQVRFTSSGATVALVNGGNITTDSSGRATITVQAGGVAGATIVTATAGSFLVTFNLTIQPPGPQVTSSSFFNGAGGQAGGVSPSAVLSIYAVGIAPGLQGCAAGNQVVGPMPLLVANVSVLFSQDTYQSYGPIYAVCNLGVGREYVTVQVPTDLPLGAASITVKANSGSTTVNAVPVTPVSPGIFQTVGTDSVSRAVLQHADGSFVTLQSPAQRGETLRAFVTGLGRPISKSGAPIGTDQGGIPGDDAAPQIPVVIGVADEGVAVDGAVYAQNLIGVWILTFEVPNDAPSGSSLDFAVAAVLNDSPTYGNPSKIPIQ